MGKEFERRFLEKLMKEERAPIDSLPKKERQRFFREMAHAVMAHADMTRPSPDGFRAYLRENEIPERAIDELVRTLYNLRAALEKSPTARERMLQERLKEIAKEIGIENED